MDVDVTWSLLHIWKMVNFKEINNLVNYLKKKKLLLYLYKVTSLILKTKHFLII